MLEFGFWNLAGAEIGAEFLLSQLPLAIIAGVAVGIVILPFALRLYGRIGGRRLARTVLSACFVIIGTIPPVVIGLLWYARQVDYLWAINGPVPFRYVGGGGQAWMWTFIWTVTFTAVCWGTAAWLEVGSHRGEGRRRQSRKALENDRSDASG